MAAPRVSFFLSHGSWPVDQALHRCDNPPCVRADHIFDGTHQENMRDCDEKGRRPRGETAGQSRLSTADVKAIRASKEHVRIIAVRFGISESYVYEVRLRRTWGHVA